jgi:hypothetical protein
MQYPPRLLVLLCIKRHLLEDAYRALVNELKSHGSFQFKTMLKIVSRHFDLEQLAHHPKDIGDSWAYNYIQFRETRLFNMKEVIALYEQDFAPDAVSKYRIHMRHKELMDLIRNISPKSQKKKATTPTSQLRFFE